MIDRRIAIIGMAGRFPGAQNVDALWKRICGGEDCIRHFSDEELSRAGIPGRVLRDPAYVKAGAILGDVSGFDAEYFGLSPAEAEITDPQQRVLLECAVEALEQAGYDPGRLDAPVGVFCGASMSTYLLYNLLPTRGFSAAQNLPIALGNDNDYVATFLSYKLNLRGPSVNVQSACSTSLLAVHLAVQSLLNGECDIALAGGVTIRVPQLQGYYYQEGGITPPDGRTRSFDAEARGAVFGSGCGVVILKRISEAIADGDSIDAIIVGSAANNDGSAKAGFTAPSVDGQAAVISEAQEIASVRADSVGLIEAHGTATPLGDPIELSALSRAFRESTERRRFCAIGSVKSNLGHLETAAGVCGLIKAALSVRSRLLPPTIHFKRPNPEFDFGSSPFYVNTDLKEWPLDEHPRRAGVSSFGIGGTNVHVILEEPPRRAARTFDKRLNEAPVLLTLSAKSRPALQGAAASWAEFLRNSEASLLTLAASAARRRAHYPERLALLGNDREEVARSAEAFARGEVVGGASTGRARERPRIVFVFPGQGAQWRGMGLALYAREPEFKRAIDDCDLALRRFCSWSLVDELHASEERSQLNRVDVIQPCVFAMQVALTALWRAYGVSPDAVIGHSMGEVAAAWATGALSLEDAARVISIRSQLVGRTSGRGAMAVIELAEGELVSRLAKYAGRAVIAALNGPTTSVVSADSDAMSELLLALEAEEIFCRRVKVDYASHGPHMDPLLPVLEEQLGTLQARPGSLAFWSCARKRYIQEGELDARYWCENLRRRVDFHHGVEALLADQFELFVEVSPLPALSGAIEDAVRKLGSSAAVLATLQKNVPEQRAFSECIGQLYAHGLEPDWNRVFSKAPPFERLPGYAWQRRPYWVGGQGVGYDVNVCAPGSGREVARGALGQALVCSADERTQFYQFELESSESEFASGPDVPLGRLVCWGTLLALLSAAAGRRLLIARSGLQNIEFRHPMFVPRAGLQVQIVLRTGEASDVQLRLSSRPRGDETARWTCHASASTVAPTALPLQVPGAETGVSMDAQRFYAELDRCGLHYRPNQRWLSDIVLGEQRASARLMASPALDELALSEITNGAMQLLHALARSADREDWTLQPVSVAHFSARPLTSRQVTLEAWVDAGVASVRALDPSGNCLLFMGGIAFARVSRHVELACRDLDGSFFSRLWREAQASALPPPRPRRVLLIESESGASMAQLVERLRRAGQECITASYGSRAASGADFALDPEQIGDFQRVLDAAGTLDAIVLLDTSGSEQANFEERWRILNGALAVTLEVVQGLARKEAVPRLYVVTSGAQACFEQDMLTDPLAASLWGVWTNIAQEHPELRPTAIDLDPHALASCLDTLVEELADPQWTSEIAFRGGTRYSAELASRPADMRVGASAFACRSDRTYLITGGLGSIGLAAAEWLAAHGAIHLALMARSAPSSAALTRVDALRSRGCRVTVLAADVAERSALSESLRALAGQSPPLSGVLHLASTRDDGTLLLSDRARFLQAMRAKMHGALHLHELTRDAALDFFVLFSSVVSLIGSHGQAGYTGANRFLDALAQHRRATGLCALSVNWGAWDADGAALDALSARRIRGLERFPAEQGFEALRRALSGTVSQVGFVPGLQLESWFEDNRALLEQPYFRNFRDASSATTQHAAQRQLDFSAFDDANARLQALTQFLREQIATVLKVPATSIEPTVSFANLGLTSLLSLELRRKIEDASGLRLAATAVYNYPTLLKLADFVATKFFSVQAEEPPRPAPVLDVEAIASLTDAAAAHLLEKHLAQLELAEPG